MAELRCLTNATILPDDRFRSSSLPAGKWLLPAEKWFRAGYPADEIPSRLCEAKGTAKLVPAHRARAKGQSSISKPCIRSA
jgi:hypothetical protein